jgi:hypothetical protein
MQEHKEKKEPWMSRLTENSKSGYDGISIMIGRIFKPTRCAASCNGHCLDPKLCESAPSALRKEKSMGKIDIVVFQQHQPQ